MAVGAHIGLVPRQVRVAEHDDVGIREPPAQARCPSGGRTAVVDEAERAPVDRHRRPLRKVEPVVVVAEDGVDGHVLGEGVQDGDVGDVAGMEDDVRDDQLGGDALDQPRLGTSAEMGVGNQQHIRHRASVLR